MDYAQLLIHRNKTNLFARMNGVRMLEVTEGFAHGEIPITHNHLNPIGSVHGGCIFTLADATAGTAACSYGDVVTTLDSNMHYLRAGLNTTCIRCDAHVLKRGKRVHVVNVEITSQDGRVLASGTFTFAVIDKIENSTILR